MAVCEEDCGHPLCLYKSPASVALEKLRKLPIIWVLGGPGSGKGTQCERIAAKYNLCHLSTGQLLREEITSTSKSSVAIREAIAKGQLISDEVVLNVLKEKMLKEVDDFDGYLIDGYPRKEEQGIEFTNTIGPVTIIIFLEVSAETMTKRILDRALTSQRADDVEETVIIRIKTFMEYNDRVLVTNADRIVTINGERDPEIIFADIVKTLDPIMIKSETSKDDNEHDKKKHHVTK